LTSFSQREVMGKGILYAVLAERNINTDGNFIIAGDNPANSPVADTVKMILPRIQFDSHKRTLTQSIYHFHYKVSGQYCYLAVTDPDFPLRITYDFLDDLETQYLRTKTTKIRTLIKDRMAYFNNTKNDRITNMQNKIEDVKGTMIDNIEKILDRGETLDSLLLRTEELKDSSSDFKKGSAKVKMGMRMRLVIIIIILIVTVVSILGILALVLGIYFGKNAHSPSPPPPETTTPPPVTPTTISPTA
jgi:hypothetical protein